MVSYKVDSIVVQLHDVYTKLVYTFLNFKGGLVCLLFFSNKTHLICDCMSQKNFSCKFSRITLVFIFLHISLWRIVPDMLSAELSLKKQIFVSRFVLSGCRKTKDKKTISTITLGGDGQFSRLSWRRCFRRPKGSVRQQNFLLYCSCSDCYCYCCC